MRAVLVEPLRTARIVDIENSLKSLQSIVGGYIQAIYPWDDPVAVICADEAFDKIPNRSLEDYDILRGTFLVVGLTEDNFGELSPALAEKYRRRFYYAEIFC